MKLSITELSELTSMDRRRIRRALADVKPEKGSRGSMLYESTVALPLLYGAGDREIGDDGKVIDLNKERAKLARVQTEKATLEVDTLKGRLILEDTVVEQGQRMVVAFRNRAMAIPTKLAPEIVMVDSVTEAQALLQGAINDALSEISDYRPAAD